MKKHFSISSLWALGLILCSGLVKAQTPTISVQPVNAAVCSTAVASFVVDATHSPMFAWQVSTDGSTWNPLTEGGSYSGVSNDTLTVYGDIALSGHMYRVVATNDSGTVTSDSAFLTVNPLPNAGVLSGLATICNTGSTTFSSTVAGGTYWSSNDAVATVNSLGMVNGVAAGSATIYYEVTNSCGSDTTERNVTVEAPIGTLSITASDKVCVSGSIMATPSVAGGMWSMSNGNATVSTSGMVTGVTAGLDTLHYSLTNACGTENASKEITIETPLTAPSVTGTHLLCVGSGSLFTTTGVGGSWYSNNADVASVDATGYVLGRGHGTAVISYIVTNSCGSLSGTDTITIESMPSMIVGSDSVGIGDMITLTDSVLGGMWYSSNAAVAEVDTFSGVVSGISAGTATISYVVTNVCGTNWVSHVVEVGDAPTAPIITGIDSVCSGSSISLTASVAGGTWTVSNATASITADGVLTGIIPDTTVTVRYTITNGFGTAVTNKIIKIRTAPHITITGPASVTAGLGYGITATPAGGTWTVVDTTSSVAFISANYFVIIRAVNADLVYTATNACGTSTDTFEIRLVTGVNEVNNNTTTTVYPNPAKGGFNLVATGLNNEAVKVVITNAVGAVVFETSVEANKAKFIALDQPAGIYNVTAISTLGTTTTKLVIAQ